MTALALWSAFYRFLDGSRHAFIPSPATSTRSPSYREQIAFEEALEGLELLDFSGYGPSPGEFLQTLETLPGRGQHFRDGVRTRRGTFQKYYTQAEIKAFLEAALDEEPVPVAPAVFYVFRDKDAEQRFLVDRYRSRRNLLRSLSAAVRERVARPGSKAMPSGRKGRAERH